MLLDVVFGTGPVGRAIIRERRAKGHEVQAFSRGGQAELGPQVEHVTSDASDP